jgi:hypothetical protein
MTVERQVPICANSVADQQQALGSLWERGKLPKALPKIEEFSGAAPRAFRRTSRSRLIL